MNNDAIRELLGGIPQHGGLAPGGPMPFTPALYWGFSSSYTIIFDEKLLGDGTQFPLDATKWVVCLAGNLRQVIPAGEPGGINFGDNYPAGVGEDSPWPPDPIDPLVAQPGGPFVGFSTYLGNIGSCASDSFVAYLGGDTNLKGADGKPVRPFIIDVVDWFPPD